MLCNKKRGKEPLQHLDDNLAVQVCNRCFTNPSAGLKIKADAKFNKCKINNACFTATEDERAAYVIVTQMLWRKQCLTMKNAMEAAQSQQSTAEAAAIEEQIEPVDNNVNLNLLETKTLSEESQFFFF